MKKRKHSALYRHIERLHGGRRWGHMLDAGTGVNSIGWMGELSTERWTAVTGSASEAARIGEASKADQRQQDRIVLGNWADPELLKGEAFDTVLADYLLGAIEGFAPYFQTYLFSRLRALTKGVLYITGLEPYVPVERPGAKDARLIWEIGRFRDACVLLAGGRPYREYPSQWVRDQLEQESFAVRDVKHFAILYKEKFVNAQIEIGLSGLYKMPDHKLANALRTRGEALRSDALKFISAEGALRSCRNYVIAAEPI